jgi:hypothetical protein
MSDDMSHEGQEQLTPAEQRALMDSVGAGDENDLTDEEVFAMWEEATPVEPEDALLILSEVQTPPAAATIWFGSTRTTTAGLHTTIRLITFAIDSGIGNVTGMLAHSRAA